MGRKILRSSFFNLDLSCRCSEGDLPILGSFGSIGAFYEPAGDMAPGNIIRKYDITEVCRQVTGIGGERVGQADPGVSEVI